MSKTNILNLTQTQCDDIIKCFGAMYERGGVVAAEIEYLLMIIFNKDTNKVNQVLDK